jgi:cell division protease FtsH
VNRFFRSAFFPLIVIVLLVWLASQTLIPKHSNSRPNVTYSTLRDDIKSHPEDIASVEFTPSKRQINVKYVDGKTATVHYPTDQSELAFEQVLQQKNVKYDSKGTGGFSWMALIGSFLPFLLLIGFWIFLMNQVQGGGSKVMSFGKSRGRRRGGRGAAGDQGVPREPEEVPGARRVDPEGRPALRASRHR